MTKMIMALQRVVLLLEWSPTNTGEPKGFFWGGGELFSFCLIRVAFDIQNYLVLYFRSGLLI